MLARCALAALLFAAPSAAQTSISVTIAAPPDGKPWPPAVNRCVGALVSDATTNGVTRLNVRGAQAHEGTFTYLVVLAIDLDAADGTSRVSAVACSVSPSSGAVDAIVGVPIGPFGTVLDGAPECSGCDTAGSPADSHAPD